MSQQQLGALALIGLGILVATGSTSATIGRYGRHRQPRESRWSRVLVALATAGLAVGFVALGAYYYGPPFPESLWLARVAEVGFVAAIAGYGVTITPAIWRALSTE